MCECHARQKRSEREEKEVHVDNVAYQSCRRTVRSSRYIVLDKKSIPMVACNRIFSLDHRCQRVARSTVHQVVRCLTW
jgi:hypothetical protein